MSLCYSGTRQRYERIALETVILSLQAKNLDRKAYPKETMQLSSIIFDMDGVLIDSEPVHKLAKKRAFERFGIPLPEDVYEKYKGRPVRPNRRPAPGRRPPDHQRLRSRAAPASARRERSLRIDHVQ